VHGENGTEGSSSPVPDFLDPATGSSTRGRLALMAGTNEGGTATVLRPRGRDRTHLQSGCRATDLMAGKGGSMHLTSVAHGMIGSCAIVGAHLTIANDAAWSAQRRGCGQVTGCSWACGPPRVPWCAMEGAAS
jgi:hypothetical protein